MFSSVFFFVTFCIIFKSALLNIVNINLKIRINYAGLISQEMQLNKHMEPFTSLT